MTAPSIDDPLGTQGKFVIFIASMMQRAGVASMNEFGELLSLYAATVADTDPREAEILKEWAATVCGPGELAQSSSPSGASSQNDSIAWA